MKEWLVNKAGGVGFAIWIVISIIFIVMPVAVLPISIWIRALIVVIIYALPMIGQLVQIAVYAWAFVVTINGPQDTVAIIFYVVFAFWVFTTLIPLIITVFFGGKKKSNWDDNHRFY